MRHLLILRGAPGAGKSTWIKENLLEDYTLSADTIRLMIQSPVLNTDGTLGISQKNDKKVWNFLFQLLEERMQRGEFTVVDATCSKTSEINRYKQLASTYRYRIFIVDFTDVPSEEAKRRNSNRVSYKIVPEEVIDKMYSRFETQNIPTGITVIKPDQLSEVWVKPIDLSHFKRIHHIGDIHGCYTALMEYLDKESDGQIKDDEMYIFVGDYLDRGIENAEVLKFLMSIMDKPNVCLLEGNHETHLRNMGNGKEIKSKEFVLNTMPELIKAGTTASDARSFTRKLRQCSWYIYKGQEFFVCHGGLSTFRDNITLIATEEMIRGCGTYADVDKCDNAFSNVVYDIRQIHGHRNPAGTPMHSATKTYNLEGRVEFGGALRCVSFWFENGELNTRETEIENSVFKPEDTPNLIDSPIADIICELRNSPLITEKNFGNISSFNFTKEAFRNQKWNDLTTKARGLFINTETGEIVGRAYEKFFNVGERPETRGDLLRNKLKFPVTAYVKENGYLGILSVDKQGEKFLFCTKSSVEGDHSKWFEDIFYNNVTKSNQQKIYDYLIKNNVSMVFEVIDPVNDPHIIEYDNAGLVLLDIVRNEINFSKYAYTDTLNVGISFGLAVKVLAKTLTDWNELYTWLKEIESKDYTYFGKYIEGFVIEDANGFIVKKKLSYYNFWKHMRNVLNTVWKQGYYDRMGSLISHEANRFCGWCKGYREEHKDENRPDIITARKLFKAQDEAL